MSKACKTQMEKFLVNSRVILSKYVNYFRLTGILAYSLGEKKKCLLDDEFASLDTSWSEKGFCNRVFSSLSLLSWNSFSVIFIHMWIYFCVRCICQLNFIFCPGFLVIINNVVQPHTINSSRPLSLGDYIVSYGKVLCVVDVKQQEK